MSSTKHIQLHAKCKPTLTIACTVIIVIMYETPNLTLQVLNPIKTNNRNRGYTYFRATGYTSPGERTSKISSKDHWSGHKNRSRNLCRLNRRHKLQLCMSVLLIWKEKWGPLVIRIRCHWRNELHDWRPLKAGYPFHGEGQPDQSNAEIAISWATA